jgi:2-keto-4-pentenoate hydratase/2-oxohepta-3-ene-1,7-dioic acid hydratase in catechol pathway
MRYAKISTADGQLYVHVEDHARALWAASPMAAPPEDALDTTHAASQFQPGPLDSFTLLAPVRPSKIVCVGRNYRDHATELGNEVPREPLLFLKPPSALLAPGGTVVMPALSKRIDFEGELAIVIGRRCRNIGEDEDARTYIRGYTLVNDVTARDIQKSDGQWTRGKGFDTFCPPAPLSPMKSILPPGSSPSPSPRASTARSARPARPPTSSSPFPSCWATSLPA